MRVHEGDTRLVERLRAGDDLAAQELASRYGAMIGQLAFRYMKNWEDAEEVAQDVLLKVIRKIEAFRGDSALASWIYRITFNTAMSRLRNARFSRPSEVLECELPELAGGTSVFEAEDWSSLADETIMRTELRQALFVALRDLPTVYRIPVVLRDIQGLSTEEASRLLRVKTQTLKSRLHRGRVFLRQRLSEFAGGLSMHRPIEA
jgi:RNA polymerase sigma-70 factor (ECF subfamily)